MEIWELEARESIRDLVAQYNVKGDAGRIDAMLELFTEDAELVLLPDRVYQGKTAIRTLFDGVARRTQEGAGAEEPVRFVRHYTATHQIDVAGRYEAQGRCYYAVLTDRGLDHWGRYLDDYRRADGRWLFSRRRVSVDGRVEESWADRVRV